MPYAMITGAAKGIGKAIATELAKRGYGLLLVDIDDAKLKATVAELQASGVTVHALQQDLAQQDAVEKIIAFTTPYHNQLNVVVNNAGHGLNGSFEQLSLAEQFGIIDVNIKAQVAITHAYITVLRQFPKSYLLNVGSIAAYQPVPYLNMYAASKAFVLSFNRSLRYELRKSTISVSCLSPGPTDTDFVKRARMGASTLKLSERFNMTAEAVGKIAVEGMFIEKAEIIPGFINLLNAFLPKFFHKSFVEKIAARIYEPKHEALPSAKEGAMME
ncbi:MAG: SDR family NAD(P)-dependent oxidoreductase [Flavisolibacter sp.]|nr:SDR family NAD(P)-dependent oxidoreductase [Flavisolibacter sp.]